MNQQHKSQAFTLVELLVSITVVVVLASIVLYGMSGMQNMAKTQRTKSQIAKIHELIMERWESYETRRPGPTLPGPFGPSNYQPESLSHLRVDALRELMRLELPDRIADVASIERTGRDVYRIVTNRGQVVPVTPVVLAQIPTLTRA